ncbi:MAG: LpqB family beta-propeller domain-containing protein, partial [Trebonia sp.]
MSHVPRARRPLTTVLAALALVVSVAGCVSMPSGGPVQPDAITQSAANDSQHYLQFIPQPPRDGWDPAQIVQGFLTASASFANGQMVAREYLTQRASSTWTPLWSAAVFSGDGPDVSSPVYPDAQSGQKATTATVTVTGTLQAKLSSSGDYAVPSGSGTVKQAPITFTLTKNGGQWRISNVPQSQRSQLLLTSVEFSADYQLRNLYFIDPTGRFLVPDPVYVPLQATPGDLMSGLVEDLIHQPPDWLSSGARTAFPTGTRLLGDVGINGGLATINLGGAFAKAQAPAQEQAAAQLSYTLAGSGQGQPNVQSIELYVNGKAWSSPKAPGNVVQNVSNSALSPPKGTNSEFYYLDTKGNVWRRQGTGGAPAKVQNIGTGYSAIAVSPDGRYLAALRRGALFTGAIGGPLVKRQSSGYTSMSWDSNDELWAVAGGDLYMLRGDVTAQSAQSPQAIPVGVTVTQGNGLPVTEPITAVRVAPDGVRMALIVGGSGTGTTLDFGAIAAPVPSQQHEGPLTVIQITLSPFYVSGGSVNFSAVTWYGPDNVITLGRAQAVQGPV